MAALRAGIMTDEKALRATSGPTAIFLYAFGPK